MASSLFCAHASGIVCARSGALVCRGRVAVGSAHAGAALFPASAGLTAEERAAFTPEEKSQLFEAFGLAAEETVVRRCATVNLTVRPKLRRMLFCAMIAMPLHCSSPDQPLSFARRNRYSLWPKTTGWTMQ